MYWYNLKFIVLLSVVTGIHGSFALADEPADHAHTQEAGEHTPAGGETIEEIKVTADPLSEVDAHIIRPVQVLSKEELKSRSIRNVGETVANELGVSSSDFGTGVGRPVIRGLGGSRVQVLENGLSTMDAAALSADHGVPLESVFSQQVEIFRGPATLLFGSGASGGIVNYVNGRILDYVPDDVEAEVALQYETVSDGMTGAGNMNFGAGNFAFHIDGMARNTDDYNIPGFGELEPGESRRGVLENSSIDTENISGGLSWIGRRGFVGFSVSRYENNYGIQGHHHHGEEDGHLHGMDDMDLHDDEHDHDEEEEHHDDEDEHHDEEEEHHDDEDEHHDEEEEHHDDEDEHHDEEEEHHDDEDEHHDEEEEHHDDEDEHHDEEEEHHDDEDEHHDEEEEHHDDEEEHHDEEEEGGVRVDMRQTRYDFAAALDDPFPGLSRIKMRWGFNDYQHDEIEPSGEVATAFDNEEVEGRVEFVHNPIGDWNGVVGFHYRHKDFAAVGAESFVLPSELESVGVFILERTDIGQWHIDLGARFEHQDSSAETGAQNDYDLFSASGGLNWDYAPGYQVGLSVSHAERAPSIEELYALGPHLATATFEIGDTNLDKEKSNNVDIYWRKTTGKFTLTANFFYNRIDDYVYKQEQDLNGDGFPDRVAENFDGNPANILDPHDDEEPLLVYLSQDDAEFLGFEAETRVRLIENDRDRMTLRLWGDYVEGERSNGINLPRITPWRFGSGLTYSRGAMSASVNYTRVNEQDNTAPLETETSGYHLLDIHADYTFRLGGNTVSLFARASNLLDEEIRRHISFVKEQAPLPGRSGIFGLRMSY